MKFHFVCERKPGVEKAPLLCAVRTINVKLVYYKPGIYRRIEVPYMHAENVIKSPVQLVFGFGTFLKSREVPRIVFEYEIFVDLH